MTIDKLLIEEERLCFKYFYENTYNGLTKDKYPKNPAIASISATGYFLAALVIGINNNWISYNLGYSHTLTTLNTLLDLENKKGFFYRYINIKTKKRALNSEISIIDTGLLLCGILLVSEYFKGEIKMKADKLYNRVNWNWYIDKNKKLFHLGYKPNRGFLGYWDNYAEQLILYILASGSKTHPIDKEIYYSFKRNKKNDIIYSWFGSLFTYQVSHAWIDFKDTYDSDNINWFDNSIKAVRANTKYCNDNKNLFNTFKLGYFGLSSTITNKGYKGKYGAYPYMDKVRIDGTISLSALISSIIFTPKKVKKTILKLYNDYPNSFGKYGFITSVNLRKRKPWFSDEYLGIDKGTTMIMIENYFNNTIWNLLMNNDYIKEGMNKLNIKKIDK